ncbi:type II toxin-antitoxin system RatA family toxin [Basilea psittacipulmonis]|uniref:Cyclase n=1 Tax=Basilea psittacipulmonis DSM 24701 TaxID=1072685 RepID=A0A077DGV4_9BURK|nr:type II toxin-antitoxin system RatA family toxin [Basilea psittacipulmonis]AIL32677.1 cyclase [Basilea psittacipulmonis DSM 24701]
MYQVNRSVLVPYSVEQMFQLVDDVDKYPEFMPWCGGATIHEKTSDSMKATIYIQFAGLKQHFTTQNKRVFPHSIQMDLVEGPFSSLKGVWEFQALDEQACKVVFNLDYSFSNILVERLIAPVFNKVANTFIDSFTNRAEAVYGQS